MSLAPQMNGAFKLGKGLEHCYHQEGVRSAVQDAQRVRSFPAAGGVASPTPARGGGHLATERTARDSNDTGRRTVADVTRPHYEQSQLYCRRSGTAGLRRRIHIDRLRSRLPIRCCTPGVVPDRVYGM